MTVTIQNMITRLLDPEVIQAIDSGVKYRAYRERWRSVYKVVSMLALKHKLHTSLNEALIGKDKKEKIEKRQALATLQMFDLVNNDANCRFISGLLLENPSHWKRYSYSRAHKDGLGKKVEYGYSALAWHLMVSLDRLKARRPEKVVEEVEAEKLQMVG